MARKKDSFVLYDLKVETRQGSRPFVCSHRAGDWFLVVGENLVFPADSSFSMYALGALLPLLPAKQRPTHANDWMTTDTDIACPDPNCGAIFRITRVGRRTFSHATTTAVPLPPPRRKPAVPLPPPRRKPAARLKPARPKPAARRRP